MKKYKTIDEVIRKGQLTVNVPVKIISIAVPILLTIAIPMLVTKEYEVIGILIGLFGGMVLGFLLAWTWWSFRIAKWRIWAFENTNKSDWAALKRRAIIKRLIWEDGNKFEKTEIRSFLEQAKIEKINSEIEVLEKEETLDKISDDPNIPIRIGYYFKKTEPILSLILALIFFGMGIFAIITDLIVGLLWIGLGIYYTDFNKIKNINKNKIQFFIGNGGIEIKKFNQFGLVKWNDIQESTIDTETGILNIWAWKGEELYEVTINLNEYQIGKYEEFLRKINVYRKRNLKKENDSEPASSSPLTRTDYLPASDRHHQGE